jgi:hypothetical protein
VTQQIAATNQRPLAVLAWGAFLACSWTWCIGMFLPVLLIRDYGPLAWIVFALPNVVGAAAMGWVLQRPGSSERMVGRHPAATTAFSVVTILFHVLFVLWVVRWLSESGGFGAWAFVAAAGGVAVVCFPLLLSRRTALPLSALLLLGSLAAFVTAVVKADHLPLPGGTASVDLLYLAPVCVVGFALCPYLDLTFHRARQALTTYGAVAAFTLGFGAMFLAMILFTLWYAPLALPGDALPPSAGSVVGRALPTVVLAAIVGHMASQSGFTVAAHAVEVTRRVRSRGRPAWWGVAAGVLFGAGVLGAIMYFRQTDGHTSAGGKWLGANEIGYRLFMAFYGLVTPAYVWNVLMPWRKGRSTDKQRWVAFVAAAVLATPGFWLGFVEQQMIWLLAGVGVILVSRPLLEWAVARQEPSPT